MGKLRLWIDEAGDGSGKLFAEFEANGFRGVGGAYFDLKVLAERAGEFARFPLQPEQPACIEGGYWSKDDLKKLGQEHLHISAFPINSRGELGLLVRATEPNEDLAVRAGFRYSASVEFKASYEQLSQFAKDLASLACGQVASVQFEELN